METCSPTTTGPCCTRTSSSLEPPAKHSASPDSEKDSTIREETSPLSFLGSLPGKNRNGSSGKTSRESSPTRRELSSPSSEGWMNSGMVWHGECWTRNTSESPKDAVVSLLSHVLETSEVPQKFFLSPKACAGILRRAEKRGKVLPPQLEAALRSGLGPPTPCAPTGSMPPKMGPDEEPH